MTIPYINLHEFVNFKWTPCHHSMADSHISDVGDSPQTWRVCGYTELAVMDS